MCLPVVLATCAVVLATSDTCSENGPVLHDRESMLATGVLTEKGFSPPQAAGFLTPAVRCLGFTPCLRTISTFALLRKKRCRVPCQLNSVRVPERRVQGKNATVFADV